MTAALKLQIFDGDNTPSPAQLQAIEASKKANRRWKRAQGAIAKSDSIDRGLKQFATVFLGAAGSACQREWVWLSQTSLAKKLGYKIAKDGTCATIKRYIRLLRQIQAITVQDWGMTEAREHFKNRYGYELRNCCRQRRQNFYKIEYGHPFWKQGRIDQSQLADARKKWRNVQAVGVLPHFAPAFRLDDERASAAQTGSLVTRFNRVTGDPQESLLEREPDAAPLSTQQAEDQAHPPTPDESDASDSSDSSSFVGQNSARHTGSTETGFRQNCPELLSHEDPNWGQNELSDDEEEFLFQLGEEILATSCEGVARDENPRAGFATPRTSTPTDSIRVRDSRRAGGGTPDAEKTLGGVEEAKEPSEPTNVSPGLPEAPVGVRESKGRDLAALIRQELEALSSVKVLVPDEPEEVEESLEEILRVW